MPHRIPDNVQTLVRECLSSIAELDLLLLLHASPQRTFTPTELSRQLRVTERFATGRLVDLSASGLVVEEGDGAYRYAFDGPRARDVDDLVAAVDRRKRAVHNLILSGPSDDVQLFSDAFLLRKKEKD